MLIYQEKWPPRPEAAPPEAPQIWGTGAYNTIIFGTTHDLCIHTSWPPRKYYFFGQHLSRDHCPPGHEHPAMRASFGM